MNRRLFTLTPIFVEYIPSDAESLQIGSLYISMKFGMVVHRCPCGCGQLSEFMLDPIRYHLEYDGDAVSFSPSISNSNLRCRSHYWIRANQIQWCSPLDDRSIEKARKRETDSAVAYHRTTKANTPRQISLWARLSQWWTNRS